MDRETRRIVEEYRRSEAGPLENNLVDELVSGERQAIVGSDGKAVKQPVALNEDGTARDAGEPPSAAGPCAAPTNDGQAGWPVVLVCCSPGRCCTGRTWCSPSVWPS